MSLVIESKVFTPAPEGLWDAVCVDVIDKGIVEGAFGAKHKCRIAWEISAKMEDGRPFIVGKTYTVSLHEKSNLYKDLKAWRGRAFTADELKAFDLEKVIGAPCKLVVTHDENDGSVYANITAIMRADKPLKPSGAYKRVKDRPQQDKPVFVPKREPQPDPTANWSQQDEQAEAAAAQAVDNSDIPF